jgi:putative heme-binding domain-containing protein
MKRLLLLGTTCLALLAPARAVDSLPRLAEILAETNDPQLQTDILRGLSAALRGRRTAPMPAGWEKVEERLSTSANGEIRTLTQALSLTFGSQRALAELRRIAADTKSEAGARRAALDALLAVRDAQLAPTLLKLVSDPEPRVAEGAIRGLASYDDPAAASTLLARYSALTASTKRDALNTLAGRAGNARQLLAAVASGAIPRTDLTADLVRQLRNHKDEALRKQLTELWGVMKETSPDMQAEVERVKRVYWAGGSTPGDGPRGRVVFNKICAQCHMLFDSGGRVGPDITGANRSDLDYLLQNILYPNAVVPNEYRATTIETKDDRTITGIVKEQNATAVVIQTANELLTVPRGEIKSQSTSDQSLMPEGLIAQLKDGEMRDLLYYLSRPGQVNLPSAK